MENVHCQPAERTRNPERMMAMRLQGALNFDWAAWAVVHGYRITATAA